MPWKKMPPISVLSWRFADSPPPLGTFTIGICDLVFPSFKIVCILTYIWESTLLVCVSLSNWGSGPTLLKLGRGDWLVFGCFLNISRVVMVARTLKLPNLQLGGSYFRLPTLEKAMTSRLGGPYLLVSTGCEGGWGGLWGVRARRPGGATATAMIYTSREEKEFKIFPFSSTNHYSIRWKAKQIRFFWDLNMFLSQKCFFFFTWLYYS